MSGKNGGVQALIKKAGYVNAKYVHCASHRLNLVLSATAERHPTIKSFFGTLDLRYTFMTGAKRHAALLDFQRERYPNAHVLELTHVILVGHLVQWKLKGFCIGLIASLIL